jgi:hypothetical protein
MKDERLKQIMKDLGYPNSISHYTAFNQVINEVSHEYEHKIKELQDLLEDSVALDLYMIVEKDARHFKKKLEKIKKLLKGI